LTFSDGGAFTSAGEARPCARVGDVHESTSVVEIDSVQTSFRSDALDRRRAVDDSGDPGFSV
jgi:hypothetical protein